jgi:hypothetical protein
MTPRSDPIEPYLRDHLAMAGDLLAGRDPRVGVNVIVERHWLALMDRYGEDALCRIVERAAQLVREVYGDGTGPTLDPLLVAEADAIAKKIAAECRSRGLQRANAPDWRIKREEINSRFDALLDGHFKHLKQRAAKPRQVHAASPPPAVYLGTWKADAEYQRGSMVTLNGTLWHAEVDSVSTRPGTSGAWKLMHKSMEPKR